MDVRRSLVCVVAVCFAVNLVPAAALAAERDTVAVVASPDATSAASGISFQAAVRDAVAALDTSTVVPSPPVAATTTRSAVRRRQGKAGMIMGMVSMIAGLAVTAYMLKEMKEDKDEVE